MQTWKIKFQYQGNQTGLGYKGRGTLITGWATSGRYGILRKFGIYMLKHVFDKALSKSISFVWTWLFAKREFLFLNTIHSLYSLIVENVCGTPDLSNTLSSNSMFHFTAQCKKTLRLFADMDESSSDSSCPPPTPPVRPALMPPDSQEKQRRSFFVRLKQRAQSRGDTPQYVLVHIVGHLRVPPRTSPQASTSRSASKSSTTGREQVSCACRATSLADHRSY